MLSHVEDGPSRPLRRPLRAGFEPIENTNAELFFSIDRFSDDFFYLSLFINLDPQSAKQDFSLPFSPCFEFIPFEPVSNLQSGAIPFERDPKGRNDPFSQFFFAPPSLTFSLIFGLAGDAAAAAAAPAAPAAGGGAGERACCGAPAAVAAVAAPPPPPPPPPPVLAAAAGSSTAAALSSPEPSATSSPLPASPGRDQGPLPRLASDLASGATSRPGREPAGTDGAGFEARGARPVAWPRFQSLASPGTPPPPMPPPVPPPCCWLCLACSCCCLTKVPLCVRSWRRRRL